MRTQTAGILGSNLGPSGSRTPGSQLQCSVSQTLRPPTLSAAPSAAQSLPWGWASPGLATAIAMAAEESPPRGRAPLASASAPCLRLLHSQQFKVAAPPPPQTQHRVEGIGGGNSSLRLLSLPVSSGGKNIPERERSQAKWGTRWKGNVS